MVAWIPGTTSPTPTGWVAGFNSMFACRSICFYAGAFRITADQGVALLAGVSYACIPHLVAETRSLTGGASGPPCTPWPYQHNRDHPETHAGNLAGREGSDIAQRTEGGRTLPGVGQDRI